MALTAMFSLAGCISVGTDYQPEHVNLPPHWTGKSGSQALDRTVLETWWQQFNDPVLDELINDALTANLDLATAQAQLREARAKRELAGAGLGPSLEASVTASRNKSSTEVGSGRTTDLYTAGFDASWEADVFGGIRRGVQAAEADVGASLETLRDTQVSLVAEVALNYIDLRTSERRLAIAEKNLFALKEIYDLARWRLQAGLVSELDVAQARTQLESAGAALPTLRTSIAQAQNRLAVLLGHAPGELHDRLVAATTIPVVHREVAVGIPADTLRQRPDVRTAERKLAAQTARLSEAEAARYPSFSLSGSIGLEALSVSALGNSGAGTHSILASIVAPIFDAGRISANIKVQHALLEQARLAYHAAVLTALEDVENALVQVNNSGERRSKLDLAVVAAKETLQIAEQRYASGLTDFLSVLDSQRTLLNLEDELATSTGNLANAQIQLYKALGGGWSPKHTPIPGKETP